MLSYESDPNAMFSEEKKKVASADPNATFSKKIVTSNSE